jgi:hypothetical protein
MYKCKYFKLHELVPSEIYHRYGDRAWEFLDDRLLMAIDNLRDHFGKMTINNWFWGGDREWSGLRTPDSPYYSPTSQHTFGRAADCLFDGYSADYARKTILKNPLEFNYINAMEMGVDWLHIDVRNCKRIKQFTP